jgi:hypothetical protein
MIYNLPLHLQSRAGLKMKRLLLISNLFFFAFTFCLFTFAFPAFLPNRSFKP